MYKKGFNIDKYTVQFPIKEGKYAETYRVKDENNKLFFLKLLVFSKMDSTQYDAEGRIWEIEISKKISHPNITSYHDSGVFIDGDERYAFIVYDFISGETLAQKMAREQRSNVFDAKRIALCILKALDYLHNLDTPINHNELTIQNIMLDMKEDGWTPKIIDFGHARCFGQEHNSFNTKDLNHFYLAPEIFKGKYSVLSDIYSVGVLIYHFLFGLPPFFFDTSALEEGETIKERLDSERKKPLKILNKNLYELDENLIKCIEKALAYNIEDRFDNINDFINALEISTLDVPKDVNARTKKERNSIKVGNGFRDVAGMTKLKEQLRSDVINIIKKPEEAKALGLSMPNGLLFFGPPGCGKTYFALKFAEEAGMNYMSADCSEIASPYIHGGQKSIASLFEEAKKNAPTILFLDEVESLITDRNKHSNVSELGEVNVFLTQLNNCGQDGVMVIGASNNPNLIDKAALRSGRLELKYYFPQPDETNRKELFEIVLRDRRKAKDIDFEKLSRLTENRVSADIKLIVDNAARYVFRDGRDEITQEDIEKAISETPPSVTADTIKKHEEIRDLFLGQERERKRVGFK